MESKIRKVSRKAAHHLGLRSKLMIGFFVLSILSVTTIFLIPDAKQEAISIFDKDYKSVKDDFKHEPSKAIKYETKTLNKGSYKVRKDPNAWKSNAEWIIGIFNGLALFVYNIKNIVKKETTNGRIP